MSFSYTKAALNAALEKITNLGLYSFTMYEGYSPVLAQLFFGDEKFGLNPTKTVRPKEIMLDATTSEDGRKVEWKTVKIAAIRTLSDGALSASTALVVDSTVWFSVGDQIKLINKTDGAESINYVAAVVDSTHITLRTAATLADNSEVIRISYSKIKSDVIDRVDYEIMKDTTDNYFQDFAAKYTITLDEVNSHIEWLVKSGSFDPKSEIQTKFIQTTISDYLELKMAQKIGVEIIWDVARAFYNGHKDSWTSAGKTRYYAGWLTEAIQAVDNISASDSDDAKLEAIFKILFDVQRTAQMFNNKKVVLVGNSAFMKEVATWKPTNYVVQTSTPTKETWFQLTKILMPNGMQDIEIMSDYTIDQLNTLDVPNAFIIPVDLVGVKARQYTGLDNEMNLEQWAFDIKVLKSVADADKMDVVTFLFYYVATFVFGWSDEKIYRRLVIK